MSYIVIRISKHRDKATNIIYKDAWALYSNIDHSIKLVEHDKASLQAFAKELNSIN
jgi:hypothetical protein